MDTIIRGGFKSWHKRLSWMFGRFGWKHYPRPRHASGKRVENTSPLFLPVPSMRITRKDGNGRSYVERKTPFTGKLPSGTPVFLHRVRFPTPAMKAMHDY